MATGCTDGAIVSANWPSVGEWVARELDDFADIWAAARIISACGAFVDVEYEDGCTESQVPIDELRPHVSGAPATEQAVDVTLGICVEETQIVAAASEEVVPVKPKTGLLARLQGLKADSLSLVQRVGPMQNQTVPHLLHRLGEVSVALLDSAFRMRPFVQALGQLSQRHEPVFADLSALATDEEETTSEPAPKSKQPTSPTYMLPVLPKQRARAASSSGSASSLPLVGSPARSLLRRRPESRGAQPSAMLLDLGVEPASQGVPLALTTPVDVPVAGKKLRASNSRGELLLLPSSPAKATLRLPSLASSTPASCSQQKQACANSVSGNRMSQASLF